MPTIAAIATPPGSGGIAIIRLSGPGAKSLLSRVFLAHSPNFSNFRPWTMHHGIMLDANDEPLDDALAVYMPGPNTYTGEEMAEIHCHGGQYLVEAALDSLLRLGARAAGPGEFTRRAFLNGRMDLTQAEAVAEIIAAPTREGLKQGLMRYEGRLAEQARLIRDKVDEIRLAATAAIDFPDDELESESGESIADRAEKVAERIAGLLKGANRGRMMREGAKIALAGAVNAGKSSLLNALAGRERALVTDLPGTTRDFIEERLDLEGLPASLIDTAGLREGASDPVERLGLAKTREIIADCDLIGLVVDAGDSQSMATGQALLAEYPEKDIFVIWNKSDLLDCGWRAPVWAEGQESLAVSALRGDNIEDLARRLRDRLLAQSGASAAEAGLAPNKRQALALEKALSELRGMAADIRAGAPLDCALARLETAASELGGIIALAADDELLDRIFSQFCIGK